MAEKNITMKRKTAQGWDVYYPKTKGGNIIQDGNNRLVTDEEKKVWNDTLTKANKYTDERIESMYRIDLTKLDPKKAYPVSFDGYTEVLIRRKAHQDGDKNPNLSLYLHTMPSNWGGDAPFYEVIHRHTYAPEKILVKKIFANMESSLTHVYLAGGYTYDIVNLLKHGKKAVVQEKDFTDPRGNKVVPVENLDSAMAQGHFRETTECNITKDTSPEALLTKKEKDEFDKIKQKHKVTEDNGTAIGLNAKTDLNTVLDTGFYRGNQLVNAPTSDAWHYLMVTKHTESYVMQVASVLDSGFNKDKNTLFIRHMINKVWTTWRAVSLREDWGLWSTNGGQDLLVHDKRALVGFNSNGEDKLHINYGNDFKNGVNVQGRLTIDGNDVIHKGWNVMRDSSTTVTLQQDWNAVTESGLYLVSDGTGAKHASTPPNCYPYGVLEVYRSGSNQALFQRYTSHQNSQVFVRSAWAKASWSAWRRLADEDAVNTRLPLTGGTVTGDITSKGRDYIVQAPSVEGGWARGLRFYNTDGKTDFGGVGLYGSGANSDYLYMSATSSPWSIDKGLFVYKDGTIKAKGNLTFNDKKVATVDDVVTGDAKQVSKTGDTMSGNLNFDKTLNGITWNMNTDYAKVYFKNDSDADTNSYLAFETGDNGNEHFKWLTKNSTTTSEMMTLNQDGLKVKGKAVAINEEVDAKLNKKLNKTSDTTDDLHMINPKVVAGSSDHGYLSFFPRTKEPTKRGAYMGFGGAGSDLMTINNETGGDLNLVGKKVLVNSKEIAMKDEVSSLVAGIGQKHKLTQDDGRPISVSDQSFNSLQAGGYYMGAEMKDAPLPNTSNWWFIEIMRHGDGWVHQRATWFNTTTVETYERQMYNKAWQNWKKTVTPHGWGFW
ncbi:pyocin knob domain-containing protein, partial [Bacillus cereus]